jgi:hypothetical protein
LPKVTSQSISFSANKAFSNLPSGQLLHSQVLVETFATDIPKRITSNITTTRADNKNPTQSASPAAPSTVKQVTQAFKPPAQRRDTDPSKAKAILPTDKDKASQVEEIISTSKEGLFEPDDESSQFFSNKSDSVKTRSVTVKENTSFAQRLSAMLDMSRRPTREEEVKLSKRREPLDVKVVEEERKSAENKDLKAHIRSPTKRAPEAQDMEVEERKSKTLTLPSKRYQEQEEDVNEQTEQEDDAGVEDLFPASEEFSATGLNFTHLKNTSQDESAAQLSSAGKEGPYWSSICSEGISSILNNFSEIRDFCDWLHSDDNCKNGNTRFCNIASILLRIILKSPGGFDILHASVKKLKNVDVEDYLQYLLNAPAEPFHISANENAEFEKYCLGKNVKAYSLTRLHCARFQLAQTISRIYSKLVQSASFYNKIKFNYFGKSGVNLQEDANLNPTKSSSQETWHLFKTETTNSTKQPLLSTRQSQSQSNINPSASSMNTSLSDITIQANFSLQSGTKVLSQRAGKPNAKDAENFLKDHELKRPKNDRSRYVTRACSHRLFPALSDKNFPLKHHSVTSFDLFNEFCGVHPGENYFVQSGLKGGVELYDGNYRENNPYLNSEESTSAIDFPGFAEKWKNLKSDKNNLAFLMLKTKVQLYFEKSPTKTSRPLTNEGLKALLHVYLASDNKLFQPSELVMDSGVHHPIAGGKVNNLITNIDWSVKFGLNSNFTWDLLRKFLDKEACVVQIPQLSLQNLIPEDCWSLYYGWECLVADDYSLSLFTLSQYLLSLAQAGLNQEIKNLTQKSRGGDQAAQKILEEFIPELKKKFNNF